MRKRIFAICLSVVVLVALIAVLVPGCTGEQCSGEIEVKATLCDAPWDGAVQYKLTGPGATAPTVINGNNVTALFDNVNCGDWTCEYVSGGPPDAYLVDITLNPTQTLTGGGTITFTLNFELDQDAWIEFDTWTINGIPIEQYEGAWWDEGDGCWYAEVIWCDVIDVHYIQGVDGCEEYDVTLNETDELEIHYAWGDPLVGPTPEEFWVYVLNDWCAVNKTAIQGPAGEKLSQVPSYKGEPVEPGGDPYPLPLCQNITLDVETSWELVKEIDYVKNINWLHIGECEPPPQPGADTPCCSLFDLLLPGQGTYGIAMRSRASVELVDDVDVDPENNSTDWSTTLRLYVYWYLL